MNRLLTTSLLASLGVALLWLRFNAEPPARGDEYPHDLLYFFYPAFDEIGRRLAQGELPLWSFDGCGGRPLLAAVQPAVLYPPNWLAALLPTSSMLSLHALGHALLGGVGAALCLARLGTPAVLAAPLGLVFVQSCVLVQSFWPPQSAVLAWWPFVWLFADRALDEKVPGAASLGLAVATALTLLAGFPQLAVYGGALVFAALLGKTIARRARGAGAWKALARVTAVAVLAAGIAAPQLGASAELLAASSRREPFTAKQTHYLVREPRAAVIASRAIQPATVRGSFELPMAAPGYLGMATFVFAGLALWARRREAGPWCLAAGAGTALLLADGHLGLAGPVYERITNLPGLGHFRAPERLLAVAFACWTALAGLGAAAWLRSFPGAEHEESDGERRARFEVVGLATFLAGVAALYGSPAAPGRAAFVVAVGAAPLLAATWLPRWRGPVRAVAPWLAAGLMILDLVLVTAPAGSFRSFPDDWATVPHIDGARVLGSADLARIRDAEPDRAELVVGRGARFLRPLGRPLAPGVERLACYETLLPAAWPLLSRVAKRRDYKAAQASNLDVGPNRNLYALSSVGLVGEIEVVSRQKLERDRARSATFREGQPLREGPPAGTRLRWHEIDALPRAYRVSRYSVEPDLERALRRVRGEGFDPHRQVILDRAPAHRSSTVLGRAIGAKIVSRTPERVEVEVRSGAPALLVLTDSYAPGWRAVVDGRETEVLRANGLYRAVALPSTGLHRVVFRYEPAGLRFGGRVALGSAALLALWLWSARRHGPRG